MYSYIIKGLYSVSSEFSTLVDIRFFVVSDRINSFLSTDLFIM